MGAQLMKGKSYQMWFLCQILHLKMIRQCQSPTSKNPVLLVISLTDCGYTWQFSTFSLRRSWFQCMQRNPKIFEVFGQRPGCHNHHLPQGEALKCLHIQGMWPNFELSQVWASHGISWFMWFMCSECEPLQFYRFPAFPIWVSRARDWLHSKSLPCRASSKVATWIIGRLDHLRLDIYSSGIAP